MRCVKRFGDTLRHVTGRKRQRVCLRSDGWGRGDTFYDICNIWEGSL